MNKNSVRKYLQQYAGGNFMPVHAKLILSSSLQDFYEKCTCKRYDLLDAENDEFIEYLSAHTFIKCDPNTRADIERIAYEFDEESRFQRFFTEDITGFDNESGEYF